MAMSPMLNYSHLDKACVTALSSKLVFLSIACLAASYVVRSVEQRAIILIPWMSWYQVHVFIWIGTDILSYFFCFKI